MVTEKFVAMLFSDLKGFSKIRNDDLKEKLISFLKKDVLDQLLNPSNHFYVNTWGDAFYICSENPVALAEIALQMRDKIKNKDWIRFGLSEDLEIRVALHAQVAKVITEFNGTISTVTGKGVDTTARIEPVTQPNEVFCSDTFHQLLLNENPRNIRGIAVGSRILAKNFGEMNLFRLGWTHELSQDTPIAATLSAPVMPKIRRKRTDREKTDFLYQAFGIFQQYFHNALDHLSKSNTDIETALRPVSHNKFVCEIYLNGQIKSRCKVWVGGGSFGDNGIKYSENHFSIEDDNSLNELFQVEDDGFEIFLRPTFDIRYSQAQDRMSAEQAAEALWIRFTDQLKY